MDAKQPRHNNNGGETIQDIYSSFCGGDGIKHGGEVGYAGSASDEGALSPEEPGMGGDRSSGGRRPERILSILGVKPYAEQLRGFWGDVRNILFSPIRLAVEGRGGLARHFVAYTREVWPYLTSKGEVLKGPLRLLETTGALYIFFATLGIGLESSARLAGLDLPDIVWTLSRPWARLLSTMINNYEWWGYTLAGSAPIVSIIRLVRLLTKPKGLRRISDAK